MSRNSSRLIYLKKNNPKNNSNKNHKKYFSEKQYYLVWLWLEQGAGHCISRCNEPLSQFSIGYWTKQSLFHCACFSGADIIHLLSMSLGFLDERKCSSKWRVIWDCIMLCIQICCGTVEAVVIEWAINFSYRSAMWWGFFSIERIIVRRYCAFWSLTTELYTELLCFSSNVQDYLLKFKSLTPDFISWFLFYPFYFIHTLCTYFCEKNCGNNANE